STSASGRNSPSGSVLRTSPAGRPAGGGGASTPPAPGAPPAAGGPRSTPGRCTRPGGPPFSRPRGGGRAATRRSPHSRRPPAVLQVDSALVECDPDTLVRRRGLNHDFKTDQVWLEPNGRSFVAPETIVGAPRLVVRDWRHRPILDLRPDRPTAQTRVADVRC